MERFRQVQLKRHQLIPLGWGQAADHFRERDKMYGTAEIRVPAVVKPSPDHNFEALALTTFGKIMEFLHIVSGSIQMPQGTSRQVSSHQGLRAGQPQSDT